MARIRDDSGGRKRGPTQDPGDHPSKQKRTDEIGVKFLLPNVVVGALLSRKAAALKRIKDQTCQEVELKLSGREQMYPGTVNERMIALTGNPHMVHRACCLLQDQIIDDPFLVTDEAGTTEHGPRQGQVKIVVSDRAASKIIGSRGAVIRDISSHFNIAINITPSKEVIVQDERIVTILGPSRNVYDALEPIIYQVSQQPAQVSPEFDYYDEIIKKMAEEEEETEQCNTKEQNTKVENESSSDNKQEADENADAVDTKKEPKAIDDTINIKKDVDDDGNEVTDTINTEEGKDIAEPTEESDATPQKEASKDSVKKPNNRVPRKDGRWVWQNDPRSNRPSWVWVDNKPQKDLNHSRYSQGPANMRY